ncbi:MAG TPA: aspartate/glutamate racemase family protein [Streptosporangiaceae bacterium]|nr:aspartate/glutamate racemase family protein [Streptosporangiaceae bacterium]
MPGHRGDRSPPRWPRHWKSFSRGAAETIPAGERAGGRSRVRLRPIIFAELVEGITTAEARSTYVRITAKLGERGCDAVALACTEIPLLIDAHSSALPVLDSTRLLAAAAFDVAVGYRMMPSWRGGATA